TLWVLMLYYSARIFSKADSLICKLFAVCSNSSYSWSLTRNLICRLSFLFSPINPTSYCSFFNRTSKHLNVSLLSTFSHAFSVVASSIFGTQITPVFAVAKMHPSPHLHAGNKTLPFLNKSQPYKTCPSPLGSPKTVFIPPSIRVLLLIR